MHYSESGSCITCSRNSVFQAPVWKGGWGGAGCPAQKPAVALGAEEGNLSTRSDWVMQVACGCCPLMGKGSLVSPACEGGKSCRGGGTQRGPAEGRDRVGVQALRVEGLSAAHTSLRKQLTLPVTPLSAQM